MTKQHYLAGVGGDPRQVPGLEGDPDLAGGDRLRPGSDPGEPGPVSRAESRSLTSDHDRAGHTPSRTAPSSLKKDGIQSTSVRGVPTQHFQCDMGHRYTC